MSRKPGSVRKTHFGFCEWNGWKKRLTWCCWMAGSESGRQGVRHEDKRQDSKNKYGGNKEWKIGRKEGRKEERKKGRTYLMNE